MRCVSLGPSSQCLILKLLSVIYRTIIVLQLDLGGFTYCASGAKVVVLIIVDKANLVILIRFVL